MANTMRTSISVPRELKARMDAAGDGINWSTVACRAFEMKLAEVIQQRGARDMQDVIRRLRATKEIEGDADLALARELGEQWAKGTAGFAELKRLGRWRDQAGRDYFAGEPMAPYCWGDLFVQAIRPQHEGDQAEAERFWLVDSGYEMARVKDVMGDVDQVRAFAEGALSVWDEVRSHV